MGQIAKPQQSTLMHTNTSPYTYQVLKTYMCSTW